MLAIRRWGDVAFARAEDAARSANTPTEMARRYYLSVAESLVPQTHAFRFDMERFESTSQAHGALIDDSPTASCSSSTGGGCLRGVPDEHTVLCAYVPADGGGRPR